MREEQRNKLEQMAALEKRSVSNLIEVMADEREIAPSSSRTCRREKRAKGKTGMDVAVPSLLFKLINTGIPLADVWPKMLAM